MGLFKNEVGRPSNETLKKRKIFYASIALVCVLLVGAGVLYFKGFFGGEIGGKSKNAALACAQPYDIKLCENEGYYGRAHGQSIQKLQELLKKAGYHYGYVNGNYGSYTVDAVKSAQKAFGLSQTGKADYKLVEKLASKYNYSYTVITYNKKKGNGSIIGTTDNKEFVMAAKTPISSSTLTLTGNTHIGWVATSTARNSSKTKYYYGCNTKNCVSPKMYTEAEKNKLGNSFYPYVFVPSENVDYSTFNSIKNVSVDVNFDAYYCSATGAKYDKKTSKCSKGIPGYGYTFLATLDINDAAAIGENYVGCNTTSSNPKSCQITLPGINPKTNAVVIGWSTQKNATTGHKPGEKITLTKNTTLYAVTRRKITVKFDKNNAQSVSAAKAECFMYGKTSCKVTTPTIYTKSGYAAAGWSEDKDGRKATVYDQNYKISISEDKTFYAIGNNLLSKFPDANLRKCVLDLHNKNYSTKRIDLTNNELKQFTVLYCEKYGIKDTTGLNNLPELRVLTIKNDKITYLDITKNTKLEGLYVNNNLLTSLDLSKNTALKYINVSYNNLTKLDLSKNNSLESIDASNNKITSFVLGNQPVLYSITISGNQLTSLDISGAPSLKRLWASGNKISNFNTSKNPKLEWLFLSNSGLKSIDVSKATSLNSLHVSYNNLSSLNVSSNKKLEELAAVGNQLTSINVGNNTLLKNLFIDDNKLTKIDLSKNTKLEKIDLRKNNLSTLSTNGLTSLVSLNVNYNKLTSLTLKGNGKLQYLDARTNKLSSVDLSGCVLLEKLDFLDNQLTGLNLSKNTKLKKLNLSDNNISKIDLSKNINLTEIDLGFNKLTSIDLSKNTELVLLHIPSNRLTSLDVSNNKKLTGLTAYNNNGLKRSDIKTGNNKSVKISVW